MTGVQCPICEEVTFTFDPEKVTDPVLKAIFADDLAKTVWIAIRRGHLVDQHFNQRCLEIAGLLRLKGWLSVEGDQLNDWLWDRDMIGSQEKDVGAQILPYIRGERRFTIRVKGDASNG